MSQLRGKSPEHVTKKLKLFCFGDSGVGKTTLACHFPKAYIIDTERGSENYDALIRRSDSVVAHLQDIDAVIAEVKALISESHNHEAVVIDSASSLWHDALLRAEQEVGTQYGAHYAEAGKRFRTLVSLLMKVDMPVIVTAHSRVVNDTNMAQIGVTFDCWKRMDYVFDLVLRIDRRGKRRVATVVKTRLAGFPDAESFPATYEELVRRHARGLQEAAETIVMATPDQVDELAKLIKTAKLSAKTVNAWLNAAQAITFADLTEEQIAKCILHVERLLEKETVEP